jgi:hypothetical protein
LFGPEDINTFRHGHARAINITRLQPPSRIDVPEPR